MDYRDDFWDLIYSDLVENCQNRDGVGVHIGNQILRVFWLQPLLLDESLATKEELDLVTFNPDIPFIILALEPGKGSLITYTYDEKEKFLLFDEEERDVLFFVEK